MSSRTGNAGRWLPQNHKRTGAWHYQLTGHKRAADFIASLEHLLLAYPAGLISVLVNNASIHTAKVVHKWLADHQRLQLVYLPAYAGHEYNPAEKIWWYLKDKVSANRGFKLLVELDHAIRRNL